MRGRMRGGGVTMRLEDLAPDGRQATLAAWAEAWQRLAPSTVPDLLALASPEIRFRDPFQEIRGRAAFERLLRHMLARLTDPRIVVTDHALGVAAGYLRWTFSVGRPGARRTIEGVSEVVFAPDGSVAAHLDHWDAGMQIYARLPLLGPAVRAVARRFAAR